VWISDADDINSSKQAGVAHGGGRDPFSIEKWHFCKPPSVTVTFVQGVHRAWLLMAWWWRVSFWFGRLDNARRRRPPGPLLLFLPYLSEEVYLPLLVQFLSRSRQHPLFLNRAVCLFALFLYLCSWPWHDSSNCTIREPSLFAASEKLPAAMSRQHRIFSTRAVAVFGFFIHSCIPCTSHIP